jgi:flavin-binding protein dodecin
VAFGSRRPAGIVHRDALPVAGIPPRICAMHDHNQCVLTQCMLFLWKIHEAGMMASLHGMNGKSTRKENVMPNSAYKVIDVIGSSETSWEDAAQRAIAVASESVHNLRVAEVVKLDLKIEAGKVVAYRTRLNLSFRIEH